MNYILILILFIVSSECRPQDRQFKPVGSFHMAEAGQGVAVDDKYIYAIDTRKIGKYEKESGKLILKWEEKESGPIIHLDSGVIKDGRLYCAHSNYPSLPMTSSVEIWDTETLDHIDSHSFGLQWGSCTWIDWYNGCWWGAFAHYEKWKDLTGKGTEWTLVVKFNTQWHVLESWVFPASVVEKLRPMSNSGGSWGPDSLLYCSGHDRSELYVFRLPEYGSVLDLVDTVPIDILGQGIAWDRSAQNVVYGIRREYRQVVVSELIVNE